MSDYVELVRTAIVNNWIAANTDDKTPEVIKIISYSSRNLSNNDLIAIYSTDNREEARFIGYQGYDREINISFNMHTMISHEHLVKMADEALRLVRALRKTLLTGAKIWRPIHDIDVSDKARGTYKWIVDTRIELKGQVIS